MIPMDRASTAELCGKCRQQIQTEMSLREARRTWRPPAGMQYQLPFHGGPMPDRKCPKLRSGGIAGANDTYACPSCGGTFSFQGGEPKLTAVGELDKLKDAMSETRADLEELKQRLPASVPWLIRRRIPRHGRSEHRGR